VLLWRAALLADLDLAKTGAYSHYPAYPSPETERAWENACRRLFFVE
jgi:hypothetical protein